MANRGSFGFKGVNGKAIKLTVQKKVSNKIMNKKTPSRLLRTVAAQMNFAGRIAARRANNSKWTPWLTGRLAGSIEWSRARANFASNTVKGQLSADTPYARRQEFEHVTKGRYIWRAVTLIAQPEFIRRLQKKGIYGKVFIGRIGSRG